MFHLKKEHVLKLLDKLFYVFLLGLGIYFIYEGDVIPRFQGKRTNFAVYLEDMKELPTLSTYFNLPNNFTLGKDFNLSFNGDILKVGQNDLQGSNLMVHVEYNIPVIPSKNLHDGGEPPYHWFRIRPMNFSSGTPVPNLKLEYNFTSPVPDPEIGIYITPENNSLWCKDRYFEGEKILYAKLGHWFQLGLQPEKYHYLKKGSGCRDKPYFEEMVQHIEVEISENNGKFCKPEHLFFECAAAKVSEKINQLPVCNRYSDEKQFWTVTLNARKKIQAKPCTKLKYHVVEQGPWSNRPNYTTFNIIVKNPYETIVNEEYIMYDMVAMISAIGGTLGLCIGFSFKECARDILCFCSDVIDKITPHKRRTKFVVGSHRHGLFQQHENVSKSILADRVRRSDPANCLLAAKLESRMDKYEKRLLEMETKLTKLGKKKSL